MGCRYAISGVFMHILIILCTLQSSVTATDDLDSENPESRYEQLQFHEDGKSVLRLHSMGDQVQEAEQKHGENSNDHPGMSHMAHMNPSLSVFLVEKSLQIGNSMPIYFPDKDPSSLYHLPREEADSIPFSSDRLAEILRIFSIEADSPKAMAMSSTLSHCESESIDGETTFCATSFEAMIDFARDVFGKGAPLKFLRTTHHRKSTGPISQTSGGLHNYTILSISREISATKMVACHTMPYPYTIFYCHHQVKKSKVYKVSLLGEYGEEVEAIVVCHMDTSAWDPNHASFQLLAIKPGTDPVCHFFPEDNLVWVPVTP